MLKESLIIEFILRLCVRRRLGKGKKLTSLHDQVDADRGALQRGWVAIGLAVVDARVGDADVGNLQTAIVVPGSSWQFTARTTSPTDTGTVRSFVTALEHHLATCGDYAIWD